MNKMLIELQRGCCATCVIILDESYKALGQRLIMDASIEDVYLFTKKPIFEEKLNILAENGELTYFVIRNINSIDSNNQNRYVGLVKDRRLGEYCLPENVIIVFTISSKEALKDITPELYHFSVVAFS